ncbi:MAG TPA: diacylglycerol kinase family protein [Geobacteraceae bacterium]|nr:diacylglycerol kinase family protein [Geobacteraceae bacterium]
MAHVCSLLINPVSGGYSEEKVRRITAALEAGGLVPELLFTKSAGDFVRLSASICREREEPFIVACGGDGTVNEVINGLEPGRATLAVLPLGTANVLARELGIRSLDDAVARIVRGEVRPLTVGLLEAGEIRRRFVLMAGVGLDGAIVRGVRLTEKRVLGKGAYLLAAARLLRFWERERLQVEVRGRRIDCHSAVVCNAARYGGGFLLAPGTDIFAPGFQILCIAAESRRAYLKLALAVISGRVAHDRNITFSTAEELTISGNKAVQVDGDYCCRTPVRITAHGGFARLIV